MLKYSLSLVIISSDTENEHDDEDDDDDPNKLWCICNKPYNNRLVLLAINVCIACFLRDR